MKHVKEFFVIMELEESACTGTADENTHEREDIMRDYITSTFPPTILNSKSDVCISIYMPTHRTAPDNKQDTIRFKNIVDKLEDMKKYDKQVAKLRQLQRDTSFWIYNLDGLVILMNQEDVNIYRLPRKVNENLVVGPRFYLKPLIRNFQSDQNYYALGLSRDSFRLFSGNRYGFQEIKIADEDRLLTEVLGDQFEGGSLNVVSHGGSGGHNPGAHGGMGANYHGHGAKNEEIKVDTQRFFNHVDQFVEKNYSGKHKIPLILVGLPENQAVFREISQSNYLVKNGVERSLEGIAFEDFHKYLWEVLEPIYLEKTDKLISRYHEGLNNDMASHSMQEVLKALVQGRVHTLVLEDGKTIKGSIDLDKVSFKITEDGDDILNQMAQMALKQNLEVVILPTERMPKYRNLFAIYRY